MYTNSHKKETVLDLLLWKKKKINPYIYFQPPGDYNIYLRLRLTVKKQNLAINIFIKISVNFNVHCMQRDQTHSSADSVKNDQEHQ